MPHADSSLVPPEITSKAEFWIHVRGQLQYLLVDQRHWVTNLANASSLIYNALLAFTPHFGNGDRAVNWCGFYLISSLFPKPRFGGVPSRNQSTATTDENTLFLGPFCGKPACQFISLSPDRGRGVCADAFLQQKIVIVPNVDEYPGHVACDGETKIVLGVLDLDCLVLGGFDEQDKFGLETIADLIVKGCDW
ncbi:GAF domain-like protein [Butyriboletus roseoflavus]|nr:GAF domain-like protein [Butyriboletus roseoflavus]